MLQQIPITILVMQYLSHCKILPCFFWRPSLRKKKQQQQKYTINKTQITSDQKVSQISFLLFAHLVVTHSPTSHTYMSMLLCPCVLLLKHCTVHAALQCSHSPCTRIFRVSRKSCTPNQHQKNAREREERKHLHGSTSMNKKRSMRTYTSWTKVKVLVAC